MSHQKISNGTVIMVQGRFVKAWYYCYQWIDSVLVEVAGIEPENSLVNSKPCTVWCPYRCPSVQIKVVTHSSNSGSSFILKRAWQNK